MVAHVPAGAKVVIEPVVPDNWATDVGRVAAVDAERRALAALPDLADRRRRATATRCPPASGATWSSTSTSARCGPSCSTSTSTSGYCWVVIGSLQAGRAFAAAQDWLRRRSPTTRELANRAKLMYHVSPFSTGTHAVPFSFDWSIDYYPRQYRRPGPGDERLPAVRREVHLVTARRLCCNHAAMSDRRPTPTAAISPARSSSPSRAAAGSARIRSWAR